MPPLRQTTQNGGSVLASSRRFAVSSFSRGAEKIVCRRIIGRKLRLVVVVVASRKDLKMSRRKQAKPRSLKREDLQSVVFEDESTQDTLTFMDTKVSSTSPTEHLEVSSVGKFASRSIMITFVCLCCKHAEISRLKRIDV
ncbi:hypothetical protein CEXT_628311 [Caerostris extrusa]|uniref:Uncharacterized protein n=1 Tax=Caerostris extrusa TaxID=172846 RepID=A0AAV4N5Y5_CAEEX|nr:hypothetical protein CEXT_628311 [Caerostris extrusa]